MALVIHCPSCSQRYQVGDGAIGKRVRCQKCGNNFTAAAPAAASAPPPAPASSREPLDPLAGVNLADLPAVAPPAPVPGRAIGFGASAVSSSSPARGLAAGSQPGVSNPSGGPTDLGMRLVCGGMLAAGIVLTIGSLGLAATNGTVYLAVFALVPLALVLGTAGLISPNVIRAIGKYGGHLPWRYKAIGYAVLGLSFLLMALSLLGLFLAGFQPERPGRGSRRPGLPRSQTAAVLDSRF